MEHFCPLFDVWFSLAISKSIWANLQYFLGWSDFFSIKWQAVQYEDFLVIFFSKHDLYICIFGLPIFTPEVSKTSSSFYLSVKILRTSFILSWIFDALFATSLSSDIISLYRSYYGFVYKYIFLQDVIKLVFSEYVLFH